jgi:small conductance mechanosensitive channel
VPARIGAGCLSLFLIIGGCAPNALAQPEPATEPSPAVVEEETTAPADRVEVAPLAEDQQIAARLLGILEATRWFDSPEVRVDEGVVFLAGTTHTDDHRTWAGNLARNTQDVAAVVNRIEVVPGSIWDFSPAYVELKGLTRQFIQSIPNFVAGLLLLVLSWLVMLLVGRLASGVVTRRFQNRLLRQVAMKVIAIPVLVLGAYLALRVSGLTRLAATVLGGTGLVGIILGIAFRDIAENFLASLLISLQSPYRVGDMIAVDGHEGIVQSVTTRGTQLMTLDGNHVQIPNSTIYKSVITNKTSNPNLRLNFVVGVDYEDSAAHAQDVVLHVLESHPAVLAEPEPLILVEELAASTVNLRVYFWINGHENSMLKVRSSVMRLAKRALQEAGLRLPDESREVIFPRGVPVLMQQEQPEVSPKQAPAEEAREISPGEGSLSAETGEIQRQAESSRRIAGGENLLEN